MLSDENKAIFMDPVGAKNGVTVQSLGILFCPRSNDTGQSLSVMALAVTVVMVVSNVVISACCNMIPGKIRIIIQLTVIAYGDLGDKCCRPSCTMCQQLSVFVGLIITNCM